MAPPLRPPTPREQRLMRQLALRVVTQRDREAALVLGDLAMEIGLKGIPTGRIRPVTWRLSDAARSYTIPRIRGTRRGPPGESSGPVASRPESDVIMQARANLIPFRQPAIELVYNIPHFTREPTDDNWGAIWTQWITPYRGTLRALYKQGLLPRTFRAREIHVLDALRAIDEDELLSYDLYLRRPPRNRKLDRLVFLFNIRRLVSDNPRTDGRRFRDPVQDDLFERGRDR